MNISEATSVLQEFGFEPLRQTEHPESFGSWYVVFPVGADEYRIVWDGKDRMLVLQQSAGSSYEDKWSRENASAVELRKQIQQI